MGITGLLPFLEKASKKTNIKEFRGYTVAIDAYCWLHKGAFGCYEKIAREEDTDIHIQYCLKYVNMLLSHDIKPILVFDGGHLPAKAETEAKRRESRKTAKKRAAELFRLGKNDEARSFLRRCVDITHAMALALIRECRARNVDCIVAPYEADAQLAFLMTRGIAQVVITEDSDLTLFGCDKVLYKLDLHGNAVLVESNRFHIAMGIRPERYSLDKFRQMCIMSGCDYLDSLPGIGLVKACKFITKTEDPDIYRALSRIPGYLNMRQLDVTDDYKDNFIRAEATFRHMLVYDPLLRKMVPLTDPKTAGTKPELCCNAGVMLDNDIAFQLALGNLDPFTLKRVDDWNPDTDLKPAGGKTSGWSQKSVAKHSSIWSRDFKIRVPPQRCNLIQTKFPVTKGRNKVLDTQLLRKEISESKDKTDDVHDGDMSLTISELSAIYTSEPPNKKQKLQTAIYIEETQMSLSSESNHSDDEINEKLDRAVVNLKRNPFAQSPTKTISVSEENTNRTPKKLRNPFSKTLLADSALKSPDVVLVENPGMTSPILKMKLSKTNSLIRTLQSPVKEQLGNQPELKSPVLNFNKTKKTAINDKKVIVSRYFSNSNIVKSPEGIVSPVGRMTSPDKSDIITIDDCYSVSPVLMKMSQKTRSRLKAKRIAKSLDLESHSATFKTDNVASLSTFSWTKDVKTKVSSSDIALRTSEAALGDYKNPKLLDRRKVRQGSLDERNFSAASTVSEEMQSSIQICDTPPDISTSVSQPIQTNIQSRFETKITSLSQSAAGDKHKGKQPCRRPGLGKQKTLPTSVQSRLSMYGFAKKPQVKH